MSCVGEASDVGASRRQDQRAQPARAQFAFLVVELELHLQVRLVALRELVVRGDRGGDHLADAKGREDLDVLVRIACAWRTDPGSDSRLSQTVKCNRRNEDRVL